VLSVLSYGATPGRNSDDASAAFRRATNTARSDEILVPKGSYVFKHPTWCSRAASGARPERAVITTKFTTRRLVTIADNLIKNALATGARGEGYGIMIGYPRSTNNGVINNRRCFAFTAR
jgi:hypothetical protein